jgi:hypothetical protein
MDNFYTLGKNKKLFELAEFPAINTGEKVVILFTGGMKSYLIGLIAKEIYGIENIIFGFISMDIFGDFKNNTKRLQVSKKNYDNAFKKLGGIHKIELDDDSFTSHEEMHHVSSKKILSKFSSVKYAITGYTKLHEEIIEMLKESGWGLGKITRNQLPAYVEKNSEKYKTLNYAIKNFNQPIHFTNKFVDFNEIQKHFYSMVRPFRNLTDHEIVELYGKMNFLKELNETMSCEVLETNEHCGKCRNCLQRKDAFLQARIKDTTKYSFKS